MLKNFSINDVCHILSIGIIEKHSKQNWYLFSTKKLLIRNLFSLLNQKIIYFLHPMNSAVYPFVTIAAIFI